MKNYQLIFWSLRFHGRIFFKQLYVDVRRIWQPSDGVICMRWTVHGVPRVPWEAEGTFDGISQYKLDSDGKIYEHAGACAFVCGWVWTRERAARSPGATQQGTNVFPQAGCVELCVGGGHAAAVAASGARRVCVGSVGTGTCVRLGLQMFACGRNAYALVAC